MTSLPEPLTPADCDLRGLEYMPLLGVQLFGSDFNTNASDSEWRAGVTLWWAAWQQVPAASLPDDDSALCRLADLGRDLKTWKKLRKGALHGWVKCEDGRLYNPTLAKQALIAWDKRVKERERKAQWRAKKAEQDQEKAVPVPRDKARPSTGQALGQDAGRDTGRDADVPADVTRRDGTYKKEASSRAHAREPDHAAAAVAETPMGAKLLQVMQAAEMTSGPTTDNMGFLRSWIDAGADFQVDIIEVAERVAKREHERGKSIGTLKYLDRAVRESIAEGKRELARLQESAGRYAAGSAH